MVSSGDGADDRPRGILSPADREFLRGEKEKYSRQARYKRERDIRERLLNALLDLPVIFELLPSEERQKVYGNLPSDMPLAVARTAVSLAYEASIYHNTPFEVPVELGIQQAVRQRHGIKRPALREPDAPREPTVNVDVGKFSIEITPAKEAMLPAIVDKVMAGDELTDREAGTLLKEYRRTGEFDPEAVLRSWYEDFEGLEGAPAAEEMIAEHRELWEDGNGDRDGREDGDAE